MAIQSMHVSAYDPIALYTVEEVSWVPLILFCSCLVTKSLHGVRQLIISYLTYSLPVKDQDINYYSLLTFIVLSVPRPTHSH